MKFQITLTFGPNDVVNDIVISSKSMQQAKETAEMKIKERWSNSLPTFSLKKISESKCESIVEGGGIDWAY